MIPVPSYLANFQCVIDAFGYWPGFHDSPVLRLESGDDAIELELEAWETSDEVDEGGYFKLIKKHGSRFVSPVWFQRIWNASHPQISSSTSAFLRRRILKGWDISRSNSTP